MTVRHGIVERVRRLVSRGLPWVTLVMAVPIVVLLIYLCNYIPLQWSMWGMVGLVVVVVVLGTLSALRDLRTLLRARALKKALHGIGRKERNRPSLLQEVTSRLIGLLLAAVGSVLLLLFWGVTFVPRNEGLPSRILDATWRTSPIMFFLSLAVALGVVAFLGLLILTGFGMIVMGARSLTTPAGPARKDRLGIAGASRPVSRRVAQVLNLSTEQAVIIHQVVPGGPADQAGVQAGDMLVRIGGRDVATMDDVSRFLIGWPAGRPVTATVLRLGSRLEVDLRPSEAGADS